MEKKAQLGIKADGSSYKALLIDDSMFIIKQLERLLKAEGFEIIDTAIDGEQGITKYEEHYPDIDIVTLDVTMPKMDGLTALEKIISFDKNANVIIISALGKENLVKKALITGAKNYVAKPLNSEKVLSKIESILKK